MGNLKREQISFIDTDGQFHHWCATCEQWHSHKATKSEILFIFNEMRES